MKIDLVFDDWQKDGKSVYQTRTGLCLRWGELHSGSTFRAEIALDHDTEQDLRDAILNGYTPVSWCALPSKP